jgi:hypothetical protein
MRHPFTRRFPAWAKQLSEAAIYHVVGYKNYNSVTRNYIKFCTAYDVEPFPVHEIPYSAWLLHICEFISIQSMPEYMAGVKYTQGLQGMPWSITDGDLVRRTRRFLKRKYGMVGKTFKTSVTLHVLRVILPLLDGWPRPRSHNDRLFAAASMIAVLGCLRGGEFTSAPSSSRPMLLGRQVSELPQCSPCPGVRIDVPKPKAKWFLLEQAVICHEVDADGPFSVRRLLRDYRARSVIHLSPSQAAFRTSSGLTMTRDFMVTKTEELLRRANIVQLGPDGLPTKVFSSSWRAGFVLALKKANVSDPVVMAAGRWSSYAWTSYYALTGHDVRLASITAWAASDPNTRTSAAGVGIPARSALDAAGQSLSPDDDPRNEISEGLPFHSVHRQSSAVAVPANFDEEASFYGRRVHRQAGNIDDNN